jgi:hypothetical protein
VNLDCHALPPCTSNGDCATGSACVQTTSGLASTCLHAVCLPACSSC